MSVEWRVGEEMDGGAVRILYGTQKETEAKAAIA